MNNFSHYLLILPCKGKHKELHWIKIWRIAVEFVVQQHVVGQETGVFIVFVSQSRKWVKSSMFAGCRVYIAADRSWNVPVTTTQSSDLG